MEEFRYIRHGQTIPEGWELVADFDDCHHGRYSQGIIRKVRDDRTESAGTNGRQAPMGSSNKP